MLSLTFSIDEGLHGLGIYMAISTISETKKM